MNEQTLYKIRREINPGWTPTEWDERPHWSDLTASQVTDFLASNTNDPFWYGHQVVVVADDGETWNEREWIEEQAELHGEEWLAELGQDEEE